MADDFYARLDEVRERQHGLEKEVALNGKELAHKLDHEDAAKLMTLIREGDERTVSEVVSRINEHRSDMRKAVDGLSQAIGNVQKTVDSDRDALVSLVNDKFKQKHWIVENAGVLLGAAALIIAIVTRDASWLGME